MSRFVRKIIALDHKTLINVVLFIAFLYASLGVVLSYGLPRPKWLYFTKPFILPVLLVYYLFNADDIYPIVLLGLACAFLGDFFLMWHHRKNFFMLGLLSFFIMQILYVLFIWKHQLTTITFSAQMLVMAGVYLLYGIFIFLILFRYLNNLMLPVIFYIVLLLSVSYFCFLNVAEHRTEIAFVQYIGSLLFMISDTLLAIESFRRPFRFSGIFIMITYIVAQLFLLAGFMNT